MKKEIEYITPLVPNLGLEGIKEGIRNARKKNWESFQSHRQFLRDFYALDQTDFDYLLKYGFIDIKTHSIYEHLPPVSSGLTKDAINTLSMIYKEPPIRSLTTSKDKIIDDNLSAVFMAEIITSQLKFSNKISYTYLFL